jgi:di/tricarboxylate transporter
VSSIHLAGIAGLVIVFVVATTRPIHLGALSLAALFILGSAFARESPAQMAAGFPVDLFLLLTGVTYLFGVATRNGTVERVVTAAAGAARGRRALVPWTVFVVAALPAMAGAIGSAGVAILAPIAMRLAERCAMNRTLMGLMVVHGAAAGNFSPLNVLAAIVRQALASRGLEMSAWALFAGNVLYNVLLGLAITWVFGRRADADREPDAVEDPLRATFQLQHLVTILAIAGVAAASLGFGLSIGFTALCAGVAIQLLFPDSTTGAEQHIAWSVVLLVCGVVTYVAALQRYGTVDAIGTRIAGLGDPLLAALLLCGVGAITSAFASSAGILAALVPLAAPLMAQGGVDTTGLVVALAVSATVVDSTPFSTVGALVVATAAEADRQRVYRGLLAWGAAMVLTAPIVCWLVFVRLDG